MGIVICLLDIVYLIVRLCTFGTIPKVCNVWNFCGFDDPSGYQSDMHLCWHNFAFYMLFVKDTGSWFLGWRRISGYGKIHSSSHQVPKTRFLGLGYFVPRVPKSPRPSFRVWETLFLESPSPGFTFWSYAQYVVSFRLLPFALRNLWFRWPFWPF